MRRTIAFVIMVAALVPVVARATDVVGIYVNGASDPNIEGNMVARNHTSSAWDNGEAAGIKVIDGSSNVVMQDNTVTDSQGRGIWTDGSRATRRSSATRCFVRQRTASDSRRATVPSSMGTPPTRGSVRSTRRAAWSSTTP